jgi:hypothetical protein
MYANSHTNSHRFDFRALLEELQLGRADEETSLIPMTSTLLWEHYL